MASQTYRVRALVLKRTKLGESDVICTLLAKDGSQIRAVAKGARKPSSHFASRLEVFSSCDLLLVKGRSLDIVKEARLYESNASLRTSLERSEAASPIVELLERATLGALESPQLYPLSMKALSYLCSCDLEQTLTISSAHLIKAVSFLGFKPELHECIGCGSAAFLQEEGAANHAVAFSCIDGGVVCNACKPAFETNTYPQSLITWLDALLYSDFETIASFTLDRATQISLLRFIQAWIKQHIGSNLKSLNFLFTYGL